MPRRVSTELLNLVGEVPNGVPTRPILAIGFQDVLSFVVESSGQDFQDGRNNLRAVMLGGWLGADILTDSIEVNSSH